MVIYMAQMVPETGRMVSNLSGNPIPFLIPIVLTFILLIRNPISFNDKRLWSFVSVMFCWSVAVCYKFHDFSSSNLSYYFFLFYAIFIAYIHVKVYGSDLFHIYEHVMVVFSVISLALWGMSLLLPFTSGLFHLFPETNRGNNVLYLFHWFDPSKVDYYSRNAGCSWEPGRFSIMLIPAIFINLSREGIKFRENKRIIILLLALASTMSTTGYSIVILLYSFFWFEKGNFKRIITFAIFLLPIIYYLFTLDFMGEKIQDRANYEGLTKKNLDRFEYNKETYGDEYLGSLDRFESAYFDWMNFQKEPLLGYGRNRDYSWFRQEISQNFELTGGLVKILSQYGAFIGLLLYIILFFSSIKISRTFPYQRGLAFALALLLCSVSYVVFTVPIFTAFWLYGLFCYEEDEITIEDGDEIAIEDEDDNEF
jgi:hypothetical protein